MNVAVIGCGNVGFAFLRWLKNSGHNVLGYDISQTVQKRIRNEIGNNCCASSYDELKACEAVFICVPTEPNVDGSADMSIYESVVIELSRILDNKRAVIVQRSTCPPGSAEKYSKLFSNNQSYAVNPSFLRKSSIEYDTEHPDRIAIGASGYGRDTLLDIYAGIDAPKIVTCNPTTIELLKYIENTLDALLITYWNCILEYSSILGIQHEDFESLLEHIGDKDKFRSVARVPGKAFGLWCLPKDLRALICAMRLSDVDSSLFEVINDINQRFGNLVGVNLVPAQELVEFRYGTTSILPRGRENIQEAMTFFHSTGV